MIIHFIYAETVYINIVYWKMYFDMLVEMVGFEPGILWVLVCSVNL
jgi:hypothetical protein